MGDNLPATLAPEIKQPWGRLVSCLPALNSIDLYAETLKIGRSPACDVVVDDNVISYNGINSNVISKEHFLVKKGPDNTAYITDLSKNGTLINGKKFERGQEVVLNDNDKIAVGKEKWNICIFKALSTAELPDTLTSSDPTSPSLPPIVDLPAWGRLLACLLHITSFDLYGCQFKVGRAPHCNAVIEEMSLDSKTKSLFSKVHFVIDKDPNDPITFITDLSKTGTYLNGRLIGKDRRNILQNNDTISVGPRKKAVYVYRSMASTAAAQYLPDALRKKYEPCALLGKGGCGEVRLAYEKRTCKKYAIKNILKGRSSQLHQLNHPSKIQTEINILKSLSHPFVIRMKDIVETDEEVFIVLELMRGGELNNRILSSTTPLTEPTAKFLFYQMALAVQFLHSKGITHRDLKPENVLLVSDDAETQLKVSDFGLSKVTEDSMMKTMCGTLRYVAPEVLSLSPEYDRQVDVWSLGVILFYMLAKTPPFDSPDKEITSKLIRCGAYSMDDSWDKVSFLAKDLVRRMLTVDPRKRITVDGILQHPWILNDIDMQRRVHSLLDVSEDVSVISIVEPPKKRIRLSSGESTD